MKKIIVLLAAWLGASVVAHAVSQPEMPLGTQHAPTNAIEQQSPANSDADKVDVGSGDDVDTVNEADPANDNDPEADYTSPSKAP